MAILLQPLPPEKAIAYLLAKGFLVSFAWQDVYAEEHALMFTVAKMARLDLLATVREHLVKALQEGRTLKEFAAELRPILEKEGWWGRKEMVDPVTGQVKEVQLGSPARLQIIYDTNLRTAYAAGRYERFQKAKARLPFFRYRTMRDGRVRPLHKSWDGVTLPQDDPWFDTHYPPNGWRCRCMVYAISAEDADKLQKSYDEAQRKAAQAQEEADRIADSKAPDDVKDAAKKAARDAADRARWIGPVRHSAPEDGLRDWVNPRTGEVRRIPNGIDPGFDYNPGRGRAAQLERLLREKEGAFAAPPRQTGVPVSIVRPDAVSEAFAATVQQTLEALPERMKADLAAGGYTVVAGRTLIDALPSLAGLTPRGYPPGSTFEHTSGVTVGKRIVIAETYLDFLTGERVQEANVAGVLRHEAGHLWDTIRGIARRPEVVAAYRADSEALRQMLPSIGHSGAAEELEYALQAGGGGLDEAVAEVLAEMLGGGSTAFVKLTAAFPTLAERLRQLLEQ